MRDSMTDDLLAASARFGADPTLVQGAGGNVSFKRDGIIWVKPSGKWLARATSEPMLIPLDLARIRRQLATADDDKLAIAGAQILKDTSLRPSIETTLHVVMPQEVVLHVHCVATIALTARLDARERISVLLRGIDWTWVPYARPGLPLTRKIEASRLGCENVLVLANHGLVVGAETVRDAEALLHEVGRRLGVVPRTAPPPDLETLGRFAESSGYRIPLHEPVHGLATDPQSLVHASAGSLYPDHTVFLGHGVAVLKDGETPRAAARRVAAQDVPEPALVLIPGVGALLREDVGLNGEEMALCLALVAARIPPEASVTVLTREQELELADWDAEKYRRSLNA